MIAKILAKLIGWVVAFPIAVFTFFILKGTWETAIAAWLFSLPMSFVFDALFASLRKKVTP